MRVLKVVLLMPVISLLLLSCSQEDKTLFTKLPESKTGIDFRNLLKEDNPEFNILFYPYYYNGSGVAVGDINNDGLVDIVFTGNMVKNRLYLNKGNFKFDDITAASHIAEKEGWCTGVTMVDINEDGWLDIYICRSALKNPEYRKNLLFINNHDLTFTEKAAEYGLDDPGYSTQASFFDYDRDGDLDMFLINQSTPEYSRGKIEFLQLRNQRGDSILENKLYRNDNGHFTNVSSSAGIRSNVLSFSLGVSTADINQDGWPDIYVANDFKEPDYFYINNRDGTFTDSLAQKIDHTSLYSMGIDVADYNNDLLPDIVELDMLPEGNHAQKMHMGGDNFTQYNYLFNGGMFPQYMKNSLQKNNGDGTFSEIGQLAGISNTDWSWSPLLADFDNDGLKDLFISNGYKRDNTDIQFIVYSMDQSLKMQQGASMVNIAEYISHMPGILLPNYIYRNDGNDHFENKVKDWGFDQNSFSHGAVYADLDNDGDLDIITNNMDDFAGVYRNNSEKLTKNNHLTIQLKGTKQNPFGIGAKIYAYAGSDKYYLEQDPVRGFQSSVDLNLHLGLGTKSKLDSLHIIWPDDKEQLLYAVAANTTLVLKQEDAKEKYFYKSMQDHPLLQKEEGVVDFVHKENFANDFTRQFLLPKTFSQNGPCMAQADVNGDGKEDLFIGGAKGQPGAIFIQTTGGRFIKLNVPVLSADSAYEDVDAAFFDADADGDMDLYVVSGSYEMEEGSPLLQDRLYLNNGKGSFTKSTGLPENLTNKSCVRPCDVDGDGDIDLFIGGFVKPGRYPENELSSLLINDGHGKFENRINEWSKSLSNEGLITDAAWIDVNGDKVNDLVVVGEWMPVKVYLNTKNSLKDVSAGYIKFPCHGWWNKILAEDMDGDGDKDLVIGNYGLNSQIKPSEKEPVQLYYTDIDKNGSIDFIMTHYIKGESHPLVAMDDLNGQVPALKKKFYDYNSYADATINDILNPEQLKNAGRLKVDCFETIYLENTGKGFVKHALPVQAQYAPMYAIVAADINKDGKKDIVLGGNCIYNRIYLARHDANHGTVLINDGKNNFSYLPQNGLQLKGDLRSAENIGNSLIFGMNNHAVQAYRY